MGKAGLGFGTCLSFRPTVDDYWILVACGVDASMYLYVQGRFHIPRLHMPVRHIEVRECRLQMLNSRVMPVTLWGVAVGGKSYKGGASGR